jgi:glycosyltransferase involved in cell wall biosynthesis
MKILIIHNYYKSRGGEDEVVDAEIRLLKEKGYEIIEFLKNSNDVSSRFQYLKMPMYLFFSLKTVFELKKIIRTSRPDIAHIHNIFPIISPSVYYYLKKNNIPIIQTIHNYRFYCSNGLCLKNNIICNKCLKLSFKNIFQICNEKKIYDLMLKIIIYFMRRLKVFDKVSCFVAPSVFIKNQLIKSGMEENKITIRRNSLDILYDDYLKIKNSQDKYFIFVGRLSKEKGILELIEIFKNLKQIKLKVLGDGPLKRAIENNIKSNNLKNIELSGYISGKNKYGLIFNSIAVLIPSICYENCPIVLLESLKLGVPVIGNNLGAIPEFIRDNYNGSIYDYRNLDMLKEQIIKLYNMGDNEREIIRINCLKSFNDLFDLNSNFNTIRDIYATFST